MNKYDAYKSVSPECGLYRITDFEVGLREQIEWQKNHST